MKNWCVIAFVMQKQMTYPFADVQVKVYVLDDGRREKMKRSTAAEEGAYYLTRENNIGYKAGNLEKRY
jgi:cellulose synthase (UDP-forming)